MEFAPEQEASFLQLVVDGQQIEHETFQNDDEARLFVNWCLAGSYTDDGITRWWQRPRTLLDGRTPVEAWPVAPSQVMGLASWLVCRSVSND